MLFSFAGPSSNGQDSGFWYPLSGFESLRPSQSFFSRLTLKRVFAASPRVHHGRRDSNREVEYREETRQWRVLRIPPSVNARGMERCEAMLGTHPRPINTICSCYPVYLRVMPCLLRPRHNILWLLENVPPYRAILCRLRRVFWQKCHFLQLFRRFSGTSKYARRKR